MAQYRNKEFVRIFWINGDLRNLLPILQSKMRPSLPSISRFINTIADRKIMAMQPFSTGLTYVNYLDEGRPGSAAYGAAKYERLVALKNKYDPTNLFRVNQNIRPA